MIAENPKFKNHPCFKKHWSGLDDIKSISLIIGKNNTGKSHLLQFIEALCTSKLGEISWDLKVEIVLTQDSLTRVFPKGTSGGNLGGDHWLEHGQLFVGKTAIWTRESAKEEEISFKEGTFYMDGFRGGSATARLQRLIKFFPQAEHSIFGKRFKHLLADRDIQPESTSNDLSWLPMAMELPTLFGASLTVLTHNTRGYLSNEIC